MQQQAQQQVQQLGESDQRVLAIASAKEQPFQRLDTASKALEWLGPL
jgi:hypothetical protein